MWTILGGCWNTTRRFGVFQMGHMRGFLERRAAAGP